MIDYKVDLQILNLSLCTAEKTRNNYKYIYVDRRLNARHTCTRMRMNRQPRNGGPAPYIKGQSVGSASPPFNPPDGCGGGGGRASRKPTATTAVAGERARARARPCVRAGPSERVARGHPGRHRRRRSRRRLTLVDGGISSTCPPARTRFSRRDRYRRAAPPPLSSAYPAPDADNLMRRLSDRSSRTRVHYSLRSTHGSDLVTQYQTIVPS